MEIWVVAASWITVQQSTRLLWAVLTAIGAATSRFGCSPPSRWATTTGVVDKNLGRPRRQNPQPTSDTQLRVREALCNQAVSFQARLPLGLVLPERLADYESRWINRALSPPGQDYWRHWSAGPATVGQKLSLGLPVQDGIAAAAARSPGSRNQQSCKEQQSNSAVIDRLSLAPASQSPGHRWVPI